MRFFTAFASACCAAMEKWAAEASEYAKKLPEREYWRGYVDGLSDARTAAEAEGGNRG